MFWNGQSDLGLRRLSGVIVIFNAKFVLELGMVRIQRGFRISGCLWDALIISVLKYVFKWLLAGTCVMKGRVNWLVKRIYELVPAWYSFYWKVVPRLWNIISAGKESILQSCVSAQREVIPESKVSLLKIADKTAWTFKFQKSCFL